MALIKETTNHRRLDIFSLKHLWSNEPECFYSRPIQENPERNCHQCGQSI